MSYEVKKIGRSKFIDEGNGEPVVLLHGLMGGLSNFDSTIDALVNAGYRVIVPRLPLYSISILNATVSGLSSWAYDLIKKKLNLTDVTLLGNSLGGHLALEIARRHPKRIKKLILTGSSGLYENLGSSYPRRGDYNYIKKKTEEVFYSPKTATKSLIDEVFGILNDRLKTLHTISLSRSAMRHNMANELPKIKQNTCLIWGTHDNVTPPEVGEEFHQLLPHSELHWMQKTGHAPMMERPDTFNSIMLNFLKRMEQGEALK